MLNFLICIFTIIIVHEFGHFIVAKKLNVNVEVFSVGVGPKIVSKFYKGTEYRLSLLPIGGYVRLEDNNINFKKDFLITVAGPLANLVLSIIIAISLNFNNTFATIFYEIKVTCVDFFTLIPQIFMNIINLVINITTEVSTEKISQNMDTVTKTYTLPQMMYIFSLIIGSLNLAPIPGLDGWTIWTYHLSKVKYVKGILTTLTTATMVVLTVIELIGLYHIIEYSIN